VTASRDDASYLAALVRTEDRPRYYATLFAPEPARSDLFALYGFAAEIARVPRQVSDPTLGRIRLQWWRDALTGEGGPRQGDAPALRAIDEAIHRHSLPAAELCSLIDARTADLHADPPPTLADLLELLEKTQSSIVRLAATVIRASGPEVAPAARHAGLAYGLAGRLASFASDRAHGRTILTPDLLATEGLEPPDVFASEPGEGLRNAVSALSSLARHHLRAAREHVSRLPRKTWPAFLPLAVVEPLLTKIGDLGDDFATRDVALSDLQMLTRIALGLLFGPKPRDS
jgi:phytoene synthase